MFKKLNFPEYSFKISKANDKVVIFDEIRKKNIILTPEEWVRQNTVRFLNVEHQIPLSRMNVERTFQINGRIKRYDVVVYNKNGELILLVECKRPNVPITQEVFNQISQYNIELNAKFLMLTNGLHHIFCNLDSEKKAFNFLRKLPTEIKYL